MNEQTEIPPMPAPPENLHLYPAETVHWMRGYASALEMCDARMHLTQIDDLRETYGYASEGEYRTSVLMRKAARS
jgi:hypothetical protein